MTKVLHKPIQEVQLHDHTCLFFNTQIEFFHCAVPFINEGLKKNEKCLIVIDNIKHDEVIQNLKYLFREINNPFEEVAKTKSIIIEEFKNIYLQEGLFNIEKTLKTYIDLIHNAKIEGYKGLRVFAELSDSLKNLIEPNEFLEWEKLADQYFESNDFIAVCAYNKKCFSSSYISKALKIHPIEINSIKTRF